MRVGDIAVGRAGDKGDMLDLTLVAQDEAAYELMSQALTTKAVAQMLNKVVPGPVLRYDLPECTFGSGEARRVAAESSARWRNTCLL